MLIGDLFERDIHRRIEEVVKVDQFNEAVVAEEIAEYVVTDAIADAYRKVFQAISSSLAEPTEGIGVWVSGFFGSGKSSFAKILGYVLENQAVAGEPAADRFLRRLTHPALANLVQLVNARLPMTAVIFDISEDRFVRTTTERVTEVMYRAFLRTLDYATDFDLAELEIALERAGRLADFEAAYVSLFGRPWAEARAEGGFAISEASAALNALDPATYPSADSWARSRGQADISPGQFAERAFELMRRRRPGCSLVFVIDEVGQYVARSVDKMLDLQGVVQAFGRVGRNLVQARQAPGQAWVVVTAQEKLDEVVDALEGRKIELARLQARFPIVVDLVPADISEVAGRRVLSKTPEAERVLGRLYDEHEARTSLLMRLERTSRRSQIERRAFVNLYPFPPHFIDLAIDVVTGMRLQPGARRHIGGSNRTIISQAQQAITAEGVGLAAAPVGRFVTLDLLYDLLRSNVSSERQRDIFEVHARFPDRPMTGRVAKAVALLEYVKDLPRTVENLAALLYPEAASDSLRDAVRDAVSALEAAQFVRLAEDGYKLQSAQEKSWETTRRGIDPRPADRHRIRAEMLAQLFGDPALRTYKYRNVRSFRVAVAVEDKRLGDEGDVLLQFTLAEDAGDLAERCREVRELSREGARANDLFVVVPLSEAVHQGVDDLFRSREMIARYERQTGRLTGEEIKLLGEEKSRRDRIARSVRAALSDAVYAGSAFSRGVEHVLAAVGATVTDAVRGFLGAVMPDLYPKFDLGARPLAGDEVERVLSASSLGGLPSVFYDGPEGLGLVVRQGDRPVPNTNAEIAREILGFIRSQHAYGSRVTGKTLEQRFRGAGYGWDLDVVRIVLAVLLRASQIEVTCQGRRLRRHDEPAARDALLKLPLFRSATFAPRETIDLKVLTQAARMYEEILGEEVDIEEGAISERVRALAERELKLAIPLLERVRALGLPGADALGQYRDTLEGLIDGAPDERVITLASTGPALKEARERARRLRDATTEANIGLLQRARAAVREKLPALARRLAADDPAVLAGERLRETVAAETFFDRLTTLAEDEATVSKTFDRFYGALHEDRRGAYLEAIDQIQGLPQWLGLPKEGQQRVIAPLARRGCPALALEAGSAHCRACAASLAEIESDLVAIDGLLRDALAEVERLCQPAERVERVRIAQFFRGSLGDTEEFRQALRRFEEHVVKLLSEGCRVIIE